MIEIYYVPCSAPSAWYSESMNPERPRLSGETYRLIRNPDGGYNKILLGEQPNNLNQIPVVRESPEDIENIYNQVAELIDPEKL